MNKMNVVLKVAVVLSLVVVSGALGYRYVVYLPNVEAYKRCLSTYPTEFKDSISLMFPGWSAPMLCENKVTFSDFSLFIRESADGMLEEEMAKLGYKEGELMSEEDKETVAKNIKERLRESSR